MKRNTILILAIAMTVVFVLFTAAVKYVDVRDIGPNMTSVGFSTLNETARVEIGTSDLFDKVSDLLLLLAIVSGFVFFMVWLVQIFKYCSFLRLDRELYLLGILYIAAVVCYILFEKLEINYSPLLDEDGKLKASFPSSHVLCCLTFFGGAMLYLRGRIRSSMLRGLLTAGFALLMVICTAARLLSGQHWLTDIAAGVLLSAALLLWYEAAACNCARRVYRPREDISHSRGGERNPFENRERAAYEREARDWGREPQWRDAYTPSDRQERQ